MLLFHHEHFVHEQFRMHSGFLIPLVSAKKRLPHVCLPRVREVNSQEVRLLVSDLCEGTQKNSKFPLVSHKKLCSVG